MKWWVRARVLKVGSTDLYRGKCVYLFNHRSWGDFIVDQYVTEGRSLFMSRCEPLAPPPRGWVVGVGGWLLSEAGSFRLTPRREGCLGSVGTPAGTGLRAGLQQGENVG